MEGMFVRVGKGAEFLRGIGCSKAKVDPGWGISSQKSSISSYLFVQSFDHHSLSFSPLSCHAAEQQSQCRSWVQHHQQQGGQIPFCAPQAAAMHQQDAE
jgi:hypothetical protein